jgi:UPF0716 protein FxsA
MKIFQFLFLALFLVPFAEIFAFIQVGGLIGAVPTILLVVISAVLGAFLLKQQGLSTWQRCQQSLVNGEIPAHEMLEGLLILCGGLLLLTPGFITDALGIICLIPSCRHKISLYLVDNYGLFAILQRYQKNKQESSVLEGVFYKEKEKDKH